MAYNSDKRPKSSGEHSIYRDFSRLTDISNMPGDSEEGKAGNRTSDRTFPVRLHFMLSELEQDGLDTIVSWQPHGRAFIVKKQEAFVARILPLWFRQTKIASFQRQLNLYGFNRITQGKDKGAYYHEKFLRGKRFLSYKIDRIKIKGNGCRKPADPKGEPNFYSMPFLPATENVPRQDKEELPARREAAAGMNAPDAMSKASYSENSSTSKKSEVVGDTLTSPLMAAVMANNPGTLEGIASNPLVNFQLAQNLAVQNAALRAALFEKSLAYPVRSFLPSPGLLSLADLYGTTPTISGLGLAEEILRQNERDARIAALQLSTLRH